MAESTTGGEGLLFLTDEQLRKGIEAMFFAYRGFTSDPDRILNTMDYGRAHHRAVHFINRSPGATVGHLLTILGVTKQSLNRVLRSLFDDGLVEARSPTGEIYGGERLREVLRGERNGSAPEQVRAVLDALGTFGGHADPHDDVTILAARLM